jgi:aminopeptidase N
MKKRQLWGLAVSLSLLTLACQLFTPAPQAPDNTGTTEPPGDPGTSAPPPQPADWDDLSIYRDGLISTEAARLDEHKGASIYHLNYTIADDLTSLTGAQTIHYTNREDTTLDEIQVRLLPNALNGEMTVSSVLVDGTALEPSYSLANSLLRIPLDPGLPPGESMDLAFEFSVNVPTEIESNYGILAYFDGVLTLAHTYPMIAVYDDEGWNAEIPPNQGDPTYADASFFLVNVDAPEQVVLVGSGREVNREENGGRQLVTYAAGPARDFYVAASPDYKLFSRTAGEVTFNAYAPENMETGAQMALNVAIEAFKVFGERYAPFPYTEFDIVSTPTYALGIEYPGVIAITEQIYDVDGLTGNNPTGVVMEATVAHEAGHQWFYNLVGNDQLDEPWLDESLTQFVTWQYYADRYGSGGASGFEQSLRSRWSNIDNRDIPIGLPVAEYDGAAYSAIVYGRGALFFDALREKMGPETFDAFMKEYVGSNAWGIGTTESMKQLAEQHCNCDLTPMYEEWVYP